MGIKDIPYSIALNVREFLAGIAAEEAAQNKNKKEAIEEINKFISQVDDNIRDVYDKFIPNVHVINITNFTNIIVNRMQVSANSFVDAGTSKDIIVRFYNTNSAEYKGLYNIILKSTREYHNSLLSKQGNMTNPIAELNNLSASLFNRVRKIDNTISARILGAEFSNRVRKVFGNRAVLAAIDTGLGSNDDTFIFFSSSFTGLGKPMKENIYKKVEEYLKSVFTTDTVSNFSLGSIVNAGHATILTDIGSYVNSPAFAQVLYGVAQGRTNLIGNTAKDIEKAAELFKLESKITENSIRVDKDLIASSSGYRILLSLGVTFTNIEDASINADRGRRFEGPTVRKFKFTKPTALSRGEITKLVNSIYRIVLRSNPALGESSRSILTFVADAIKGEILGKPTKSESTKHTSKTKTTVYSVKTTKSNNNKFATPSVNKRSTNIKRFTGAGSNIASLQLLLQERLSEQVRKNMGTGNDKKILNYRSGRLANSASIERISESRAGMVSIFYNYMRNPYATFSEGGRQQYPRSRDPKLLISKSIRELAMPIVGSRMRAVLV